MKFFKLFLVGAIGFNTFFAQAQTLAPEVLSAAGGKSKINNISIGWTLGETAVSHWSLPNGDSVTEGFHQPKLVFNQIGTPDVVLVRIAPNPVQSNLQLLIDSKKAKDLSATLVDVQGRILLQLNHLSEGSTQVDLNQYSSGVYFLSIQYANETPLQIFKVVKTK